MIQQDNYNIIYDTVSMGGVHVHTVQNEIITFATRKPTSMSLLLFLFSSLNDSSCHLFMMHIAMHLAYTNLPQLRIVSSVHEAINVAEYLHK